MIWASQLEVLGEVAFAMLLGGLIGIEREIADKPAGFRTHMLVAGASALLVGLGGIMLQRVSVGSESSGVKADPILIVEAIITGISFICAGTIFRRRAGDQVEGLTTAATILLASALGICVALRQFVLAIGATLLALLVLRSLKGVEGWIRSRQGGKDSNKSPLEKT